MAQKLNIDPDYDKLEEYYELFSKPVVDHYLVKSVLYSNERKRKALEHNIQRWNKHVEEYHESIKQLLKEFDLPETHSDNLCYVSMLMSESTNKALDYSESLELEKKEQQRKKKKQLSLLANAFDKESLEGIVFRFRNMDDVYINVNPYISFFSDYVGRTIKADKNDEIINEPATKKQRKSSRAYQIYVSRFLMSYLQGENLLRIKCSLKNPKRAIYQFIYDFFMTIDRPFQYSEGKSPGKEVHNDEAQDFVKELLRTK